MDGSSRRNLRIERLEDRRVLATYSVTDLSDFAVSGPGSAPGTLRQAIYDANLSSEADVIEFAANLSGGINLSVADDTGVGTSALLITSNITFHGNDNGITITRDTSAAEMRLFRVTVGGNLSLDSITLSGGMAHGANGGPGQNGGDAWGGALYNEGTVQLIASTLNNNAAAGGNAGSGGSHGAGFGGALYNDGGTVSIRNATISNNSVASGTGSGGSSRGGAIYSKNGSLTVHNSTITKNSAAAGRDVYILGVGAGHTAVAQIFSSIIAQADHTQAAFDFVAAADETGGQVSVTGANNLIRSQNDYQSITVSTDDPLLGDLADNHGPTRTHALQPGSPAIDLGSNPLNLTSDQRGNLFARVAGGVADIGAVEFQQYPTGPAGRFRWQPYS